MIAVKYLIPYRWRAAPQSSSRVSPLWTSAAWIFALAVLAKLVGALKEVLVAERFGAGALVDQFVFVCTLAAWPAALATSILTATLVPLLARPGALRHALDARRLRRLPWMLAGVAIGVSALFVWVLPVVSPMGASAPAAFAPALVVMVALGLSASLSGALLQAAGRHVGVLLEALPAATMALLLLLVAGAPGGLLAAGAAAGALVHAVVLGLVWRRVATQMPQGLPPALPPTLQNLTGRGLGWRGVRQGIGLAALAYAVMSVTPAIELALAGHLGEGSTASLGYAMRIAALASGLVAVAVNRVALLHFCGGVARAQGWHGPMLGFGVAAALLSAAIGVLAPQLVAALFERGAFDAAATARVAGLTRWQVASLAPYVVSMVLCAALVARGRLRALLEASLLCTLARVGVAAGGTHALDNHVLDTHGALQAIAAAPLAGYTLMCLWLGWRLWHDDRRLAPQAPEGNEAFDTLATATRPVPLGP